MFSRLSSKFQMLDSKQVLNRRQIAIAALLTASLPAFLNPAAASAASQEQRRAALMNVPPSSQLQSAIEQYQALDPKARFSLFRGHVDTFRSVPRETIPGYARIVLEHAGLPVEAVIPETESTSFEPKNAEGSAGISVEADGGTAVGNPGDDDGGIVDQTTPVVPDENGSETTWYEQSGEEVVEKILRRFLHARREVFELNSQWLAPGLPNLELEQYGVGQHFRRAVFTQISNGIPVLDSKTVVLFDLNWNVVVISRQLMTPQKLGVDAVNGIGQQQAENLAAAALGLTASSSRILESERGIDVMRQVVAWQVLVEDSSDLSEYRVTLLDQDGSVLHLSDESARYNDAQVKRWDYTDGDATLPNRVTTTGLYTHDDNSLVHDFFYLVNDDRNDGGTGVCNDTSPASNSTPGAYGTKTSSEYIRPTLRSDRNFSLWNPNAPKGSFGEGHVYYWARKYVQWQKQALVDLGVLTLGNFNNYTKALIIVNACNTGAGNYFSNFDVSTLDDLGECLGTIRLPERCRKGNSNCSSLDYQAPSNQTYTFEGNGGYHFPGVIHHELNHFVMIDYLGVGNSLDCASFVEQKYFQEGGLGRTLPQMYWHNHYDVTYLPNTTNKLYRSNVTSGEVHDETNEAGTLHELASFSCATGTGNPYDWGSVVGQPMWEIYHGQKIVAGVRSNMARPALDKGMIKGMYYAADLASASTFRDRWELANRFMEFWELFSTAIPSTKTDWCDVWGHHGMSTFIDSSFCS